MALNRPRFRPHLVVDNPPCVIVPPAELPPAEHIQQPITPRQRYVADWMQGEAFAYTAAVRRRRRRPFIVGALVLVALLVAARTWAAPLLTVPQEAMPEMPVNP